MLLLSACSAYPDFDKNKHNMGTIAIFADTTIAYDIDGKIDEININESHKITDEILRSTKKQLITSGYKVGNTVVSSLGKGIRPKKDVKKNKYIVQYDDSTAPILGDLIPPLFYVAQQFENLNSSQALSDIYSMIRVLKTKKARELNNSTDGRLRNTSLIHSVIKDIEEDQAIFVQSHTRKISTGKAIAQNLALLPLALLLGGGGGISIVAASTYTESSVAILDVKTGQIIWSDFSSRNGSAESVSSLIRRVTTTSSPLQYSFRLQR